MSTPRVATRWGAGLATTILLSLIPAHAAGLIALVATGSGAAVAAAVLATLTACVAFNLKGPAAPEAADPAPASNSGRTMPWVLALAAVPISFLITYPRLSSIGRLIVGNTGDSGLNIYLFEWQVHAAAADLGSYFELNIFAPEKFTLFWGPALTPLMPAYALLKALTGNPIATFNLLMVAATGATMVAAYLFARKAGFGPISSALGGLLYATTGQRIAHLGHLDSFQTLWIPIFGLLLLSIWEKNRLRDGVLLGLVLGFSLLSAPYYFLSGIAVVGLMAVLHLPSGWKSLPWKGLMATVASGLLISGPVLLMSRLAGLSRNPEELVAISWADFYHPGSYTPAVGWLSRAAGQMGGGRTLENWLFSSLVLTALATLGALAWLKASRSGRSVLPLPEGHPKSLKPLMGSLAVSGVVMAVGPYLTIAGKRIPLPMLFLMKLPGFESARVTGRFIAPAFLALSIVSLVGLENLLSRVRSITRPPIVGALAVLALITTQAFYPAAALDVSGRPAEVNRAMAKRPEGLVVELPWSGCPGYGCLFTEPPRMIWSRFDWFPRLGGYSGHIPSYWIDAQESLGGFPDPDSARFLRRFGTRYVILRVSAGEQGTHFSDEEAASIAGRAGQDTSVTKVEKFGDDYLLTLR